MNKIGLLFLFLTVTACSTSRPFKTSDGKKLPNSIAEIRRLKINGIKQFLTIRGVDRAKPVLLWLHGGPGNVAMPLYMHYSASLEEQFVVVYWDQRGSGKSYSSRISPASMTLNQFVSDTHELTKWLKTRFNQDKLFMVGHSWGGLLGFHVIDKYPADYRAFVAVSPITNGPRSEQVSYEFTLAQAQQRQDTVALTVLKQIGQPVNGIYKGGFEATLQERNLVQKYGGDYHRDLGGTFYRILRRSTEYNLLDYLKTKKIARLNSPMDHAIWPTIDLRGQIPVVNVPVYFCLGRYDNHLPSSVIADYYASLQAPLKELIWFDDSGHYSCFEESEKFNSILKKKLLPLISQ
ncbi:alpha/beta fold hydrolase [Fibrella forsythiae]|uniref:Alpha/beta hydrolase n=1 Tax=Fibrella forsythiae TaxID=2817061 RepID=A0ABS3JT21_9BACT|nr:alpha/beta hydrolase [Fibrella forsythiae]MBO0953160.1 alpha/beta hydrolase [Fibrella forsythiae]